MYGKIQSINKTDGTSITYSYDAGGNRISKAVTIAGVTKSTYYVRDASGNVMSIYTQDAAINSGQLTQTEIHLYGSSRLGLVNTSTNVQALANTNGITTFIKGNKVFELSNHLGNVLVTISDKKIGVSSNGTTIDYYNADVVTAKDYYPFGMQMPGRNYTQPNSNYRYGFNGQEKTPEIFEGSTTAEYWEYDSRIGKRWNLESLTAKYPSLSPYVVLRNNPISVIDPDGMDVIFVNGYRFGEVNDAKYRKEYLEKTLKKTYWNRVNRSFTKDVERYFNDKAEHFVSGDHWAGSSAHSRIK